VEESEVEESESEEEGGATEEKRQLEGGRENLEDALENREMEEIMSTCVLSLAKS
jgi:hypothetical protein